MVKAYQKPDLIIFLAQIKAFSLQDPQPPTFRTLAVICFRFYFTSVQTDVYSLGKAHMRSIPSLRSFLMLPLKQFRCSSEWRWPFLVVSRKTVEPFLFSCLGFLLNIFVNSRGEKMDPRRQFLWNVRLNIWWKFIFWIVVISHWNGGLFQGESSAAVALASLNYPSAWGKGYTIRQRFYCSLGIVNVCKQIIHALQRSGSSPR